EWRELARLQLQTGNTAMYLFFLAVVLVFLVLAAQYESWSLPLAVILVVPMCLLCSIAAVLAAHLDVNIFTQVGFVVLIGLACKNAILIVEFARARRQGGMSRFDATLAGCGLRLRPIVMTSFAFILGVVPLVLSVGAGAEMRRTLGTAVFGGMLGVTLFGIFLTPVFFYTIEGFNSLARRVRSWRQGDTGNGQPSEPALIRRPVNEGRLTVVETSPHLASTCGISVQVPARAMILTGPPKSRMLVELTPGCSTIFAAPGSDNAYHRNDLPAELTPSA